MRNRKRQGGHTLLEIALDVHMTTTGSMERSGWDSNSQKYDIETLKEAILTWEPSTNPNHEKFDNAVKNLIIAAIEETT